MAEGLIIFDHTFCGYTTVHMLSFGLKESTHDLTKKDFASNTAHQ